MLIVLESFRLRTTKCHKSAQAFRILLVWGHFVYASILLFLHLLEFFRERLNIKNGVIFIVVLSIKG